MLTYLTAGESHGPQLTAVMDGLPAGITINIDQINYQLIRRQKGYGRGGRQKIEKDRAEITSGLRHGVTMGGPITLIIENKDWVNWKNIMDPVNPLSDDLDPDEHRKALETTKPRPGHADLPGGIKWHHHDLRNVLERSSARETAARVALGALARQFLERFGIQIASHVIRIGPVTLQHPAETSDIESLMKQTESSEVRCTDPEVSKRMIKAIQEAISRHDSLGGIAEVIIRGLPVGLGGCSQWYHRLDGRLAGAIMAIHSAKGVEIGLGFEAAKHHGSQVHDQIFFDPDGDPRKKRFRRSSNNAGGLEGGMTNGEDIIVRVACKPISTLGQPLETVDVKTRKAAKAMVERADCCVVPAFAVICEAVAVLVLAEVFLHKFGSDNIIETERNYNAFLAAEY